MYATIFKSNFEKLKQGLTIRAVWQQKTCNRKPATAKKSRKTVKNEAVKEEKIEEKPKRTRKPAEKKATDGEKKAQPTAKRVRKSSTKAETPSTTQSTEEIEKEVKKVARHRNNARKEQIKSATAEELKEAIQSLVAEENNVEIKITSAKKRTRQTVPATNMAIPEEANGTPNETK